MDMEWTTPLLTPGQWPAALDAALRALADRGLTEGELLHGWSMSAFSDAAEYTALEWQTEPVMLADVPQLLRCRESLGFRLGQDDVFLSWPGGGEVKLCHEGDLHLRTDDPALAAEMERHLRVLGVSWQAAPPCTLEP